MPVGVIARVATCMCGPGISPLAMACLTINVGVHCAFGFEVAQHGEAMGERDLRIARRQDGAVRNGLLEELLVVVFRGDIALQQNVGVGIDKAGKDGGLRKIDQFDARGRGAARGDAENLVTFDEDESIRNGGIAFAVDQAPGTNGDALRGWSRGLLRVNEAARNRKK